MGNIYLWTGDGWGKTTSAIGAAVRAVGHNKKVLIVQFMKGRKDSIGEYKIRTKFGKLYQIHQFGRKGWVNLKKPGEKDRVLAGKGFDFVKKAARQKPFLLVLDEINLACSAGLLKTGEVISFLKTIPKTMHVYLTGRRAPEKLLAFADYVNVIEIKKGPKRLIGKKGIDY